ncbi:galactoside alpha-(1,2)-fucosyltransferase 1-like [Watersipora subatra]|uniref:galactoside alpha-(1,2)-fucosyltransferase 1-like n=1 Tax=Watersipora subatra TaxID=2589382 RepID=UPI00355BAC07
MAKKRYILLLALMLAASYTYFNHFYKSLSQNTSLADLSEPQVSAACGNECSRNEDRVKPTLNTSLITHEHSVNYLFQLEKCNTCLAGKRLISVHPDWICGLERLGNKMFMIAAAVGAAALWNIGFVLPHDRENCTWLSSLHEVFIRIQTSIPVLPYHVIVAWKTDVEKGFTTYGAVQPSYDQNISISGFRQSWKYFVDERSQKAVREMFRFKKTYVTYANAVLRNASLAFNLSNPIFIGLHMRIGDLDSEPFVKYGYQRASKMFYRKAIDVVQKRFNHSGSLIYIAASDTISAAKEMLREANVRIYWSTGTRFQDLACLASCNHSIISGGSYGFWAAWLANGETYYFSNFARPGSEFYSKFDSLNFYLPNWLPLGY